jgi:cysteine desulfuration protein SufE
MRVRFQRLAGLCLLALSSAVAFLPSPGPGLELAARKSPVGPLRRLAMSSSADLDEEAALGLTPKLKLRSQTFRLMDDRGRVQQLLQLANTLPPLPDYLKMAENKVPGCLSTVYIHAYLKDGKVQYEGDSDAQLTKGLVALLIEGLSGSAAHEIQALKPEFIKYTGIGASLTPGCVRACLLLRARGLLTFAGGG